MKEELKQSRIGKLRDLLSVRQVSTFRQELISSVKVFSVLYFFAFTFFVNGSLFERVVLVIYTAILLLGLIYILFSYVSELFASNISKENLNLIISKSLVEYLGSLLMIKYILFVIPRFLQGNHQGILCDIRTAIYGFYDIFQPQFIINVLLALGVLLMTQYLFLKIWRNA